MDLRPGQACGAAFEGTKVQVGVTKEAERPCAVRWALYVHATWVRTGNHYGFACKDRPLVILIRPDLAQPLTRSQRQARPSASRATPMQRRPCSTEGRQLGGIAYAKELESC